MARAATTRLSFNGLKGLFSTTDGNLSVHARKLEEAGYVPAPGPSTTVRRRQSRITEAGRKALKAYLNQMEHIIQMTRE